MSDPDTDIGGRNARFPATRVTAIAALRSDDAVVRERALDLLVRAYWKPVYKFLRIRWSQSNEDAKDMTQGFFATAIEKRWLVEYDPLKGTFRTFLRTILDRFMSNERKAERRLKRGGGMTAVPLDFDLAERELQRVTKTVQIEELFDRELARSLFTEAVAMLRDECARDGRMNQFRAFEAYDLEDGTGSRPSYSSIAAELGVPLTTVTNQLAAARRRFRNIVLDRLREITATEEEFRAEARALLGIEVA